MLLVYPMLVSQSVSKNIVPGLCKVMERYLLIRILQEHALNLRNSKPSVMVGESSWLVENAVNYEIDRLLREEEDEGGVEIVYGPPPGHNPSGRQKPGYKDVKYTYADDDEEEKEKQAEKQKKPGVKITQSASFNTISLEPTYAEVDDVEGKIIYGVKVVAFPMLIEKENATFTLFNKDWQRGFLSTVVRKLGRATIRMVYSLKNKFLRMLKLSPTITADPIKDIVYGANLKVSDSVFMALTTGDIGDEVLSKPAFIKKLMKLYWNSFIICDETKKEASICMKSFNGLCSKLNYSILMTGINTNLGKVYDGIEQLQRESRPFFKLRRF